tara:strand:- start:913 stop:1494 length:582 start_codon:yes stop_codon:yes gene_type:complete
MGALSDLDMLEKEAKNPPIFKKLFNGKSVEQEAIEAFAAKEKAQQQRYELQQWISMTLGRKKWDDLVRMEGSIRKQRQETLYKQRKRRQKFVEIVAWIMMAVVAAALLTLFVLFLKGQAAKAQPEHVVCRLVGCEVFQGKRWCVYKGAWNTQESMSFGMSEWFPREYLCDFVPDAPKPPSMRDTLKAIRESQK